MVNSFYPHLLVIRCSVHTLELLQGTIINSHSCLIRVAKSVRKLAKLVRAHKHWRSLLFKTQKMLDPDGTAIKLVVHSNTRKWSSTYLVLARIVRLKPTVQCLLSSKPPKGVPHLPDMPWSDLDLCSEILFQFYVREQVLQRDGANVVEMAYLWHTLKLCVEKHIQVCRFLIDLIVRY